MEKAAQLARRLGHATSKAVIGIINSGVMNCLVFATDVRNNNAAKGVSVAGLLGKTAKKGSIFPGYVLAPVLRRYNKSSKRTLKNRYPCHELALPFVMTHTLIVWCVLFCMHSVNLQPNASSVDKVSPYEQFYGFKLDAKRDLRVGFGHYAIATNAMTDNSMGPRAG